MKLLSRPVVCTNFQGLETNTFFLLALSIKATVLKKIMSETLNSSVRKYNSANESQQKLSGGCDYYRVTVNSGHRIAGSNVSDALYRISGVFPNNNAQLLNGSWEVFLEHFSSG